ncbi:hypothetical protein K488DRAFT_60172, partial [Vararia minispora EC-137]
KLLWRSDFETNPFPIPVLGDRFFKIPAKAAYGVFGTRLSTRYGIPSLLRSGTR